MTILTDTFRKARKSWNCHECRRRIQPGETYHLQTVADSGTIASYRTCGQCQEMRLVVSDDFEFHGEEFLLDETIRDWAETRGASAMRIYAW